MTCVHGKRKTGDSLHDSYTLYAAVTELTAGIENVRHKSYMHNLFSFPLNNLHTKTIKCCRTFRPNRKEMLKNFRLKIKLEIGDKA